MRDKLDRLGLRILQSAANILGIPIERKNRYQLRNSIKQKISSIPEGGTKMNRRQWSFFTLLVALLFLGIGWLIWGSRISFRATARESDPYTIKAGSDWEADFSEELADLLESFENEIEEQRAEINRLRSQLGSSEADYPKKAESDREMLVVQEGPAGFSISGALESVDPANVLRAQGEDEFGNEFANTLGLGSEMMLAEPGSILFGPDFDDAEMVNESPHMDWISPITQFTLTDPVEENGNAAEGAFLWFTGAMVEAQVRDFHIVLEGKEGHNWFLLIRGLFPDGKQDSDRNSTVALTEYVAGHAQVMLYPPGAYISEENFEQVAETSHTSGRNCGNEGCSELSVMMFDLNTGAWVVVHQPQLDAEWQFVDSNWR